MVRIVPSMKLAERYGSNILNFSSFMNCHCGVHRNITNNLLRPSRWREMLSFRNELHMYVSYLIQHVPDIIDNVSIVPEHLGEPKAVEQWLATPKSATPKLDISKEAGKEIWNDTGTQPFNISQIPKLQKNEAASTASIIKNHSTFSNTQFLHTNFKDSAANLRGTVERTTLAEHLQATEGPTDATIVDHENKLTCQDVRHGIETAEGHQEDTKTVNDCFSHAVSSFCSSSPGRPESKLGFTSIDRDLYDSKLALETYLCRSKNLSLQDASSMAENAPLYVAKLKVLAENWKKLSPGFSNDSSMKLTIESYLEENGLDELGLFLESIGTNPEYVSKISLSLQLKLTGEHSVLPTVTLLEGIGVERRDLGKLIERNWFILCYSASELQAGLDFLMHVGLQKADLVSVLHRCPEILKPNLKEDWAPLLEILSEFHVGENAVARLIKHHPKPLADLPHRNIQTNLDYLHSLGLKKDDIARILKRTPSVLFMDVEKSLKVKAQFLKDQGLSDGEISRVVSLFPGIFSRSIEESLHPKLKFLQSLGLEKEQTGKIISSFPALLGHSIDNKMKPLVALLCTVGIKDKLLARLIAVRPSIFAVDVKKILPDLLEVLVKLGDPRTIYLVLSRGLCEGLSALKERLEYLSSLGFTRKELAMMIQNDPRIMQISKLQLQKKVEFLTRNMGYSLKDLVNNSTFLYSHFERRIQRRYGVLNVLQSSDVIRGKPSLSQITRRSDTKFRKKYVDPYPQCQSIFKWKR